MTRSKVMRTTASVLVVLAVVALSVWYVAGHTEQFSRIRDMDARSFLSLSVLCIVAILVSGLQMNAIVTIFGTRISAWEGFGLSAVNTMANFYVTKVGLAAKAIYLKKQHNFDYMNYVSAMAGATVVSFIAQGAVGLGSYLALTRGVGLRWEIATIFSGLMLGGFLPLLIPGMRISSSRPFMNKVSRVFAGWDKVRTHHRALSMIAILNVAYALIGAARLLVSYRALGYDVEFLRCLVLAPLSTVTMIASVTPGAVGIRQALVGYGSNLLGVGMAEGVVASTIDHAVGTIWVFVFGLIFTNWIWAKDLRQKAAGRES